MNKHKHFFHIPVLVSMLLVALIFSPVMAGDEKSMYGGCPYLQHYHQVMEWHQRLLDEPNLIPVNLPVELEPVQPGIRNVVRF